MSYTSNLFKKNGNILIFTVLTVLIYFVLYITRIADDNRLTSWQWVFNNANVIEIFPILLAGFIPAYLFSRVSFFERHPVICLFSLSYIIAALFWREPEVIVDASRYFTQAKYLEVYGIEKFIKEWGRDINVWTDMPLMPFLYGLIFRFFGEVRAYIQIFITFLFAMTVVLTYLIGKDLWDEEIGFSAGLLLLGMPYLLTQAPLMLVDVPAMFFLTLSVFTYIRSLKHGGMWLCFSSVAVFLAFFSKYSAWLMLSVLLIVFFVFLKISLHPQKGDSGNRWRTISYRTALITSAAALLIGVVFWYKSDVFMSQIGLLLDYQRPGLRRWSESFISTFFFQTNLFIAAAALYSAYAAFKKRDLKYLVIIWLIFLVTILQIKRIRYIIMAFPMLALMASYGLQEIKDKRIVKFMSFYVVVFSVIVAFFAYLPFLNSTSQANIKNAGAFLNSLSATDVEVFTVRTGNSDVNPAVSVPLLDLFTAKKIRYYYNGSSSLPFNDVEKSPLRFTWELKNYRYYNGDNNFFAEAGAVVIISDGLGQVIPFDIKQKIKKYRNSASFDVSEGIFRYTPVVKIYY
jgi:4-amino-4-deoxy-L-arabinose transferase-like glycosyltransferase